MRGDVQLKTEPEKRRSDILELNNHFDLTFVKMVSTHLRRLLLYRTETLTSATS